jgi:hypothetical protein
MFFPFENSLRRGFLASSIFLDKEAGQMLYLLKIQLNFIQKKPLNIKNF